jgi:hypothetical protein
LRARPETLLARIGSGVGRRADALDLGWIRERVAARAAAYAAVADQTIDVDDRSVDAVATGILRRLGSSAG